MTSREVIRKLEQAGFQKVGQRGSHLKLRHPDGRTVIVPDPRKDIKLGTLRSIERQAGVPLLPTRPPRGTS
ncbi:type II toxin-antitoxin system HicA family toxin [Desulfocurvus vexinensis]|uniref:type II toxin-antitoxin system HicA family toxin n=1 Tax=Desulfocurvus vexinensis TaxID=399548 RepID=UPI0009FFF6D7|nr:type II toxin-antitoxin system HicA family toxin [Desulfocurvus vexinensis]